MSKDRVALIRGFRSTPSDPKIEERKRKFAALCEFIHEGGGWMTSIPADPAMRFQALPGSPVPRMLEAHGYIVEKTGTTERILPHAIRQDMTMSSSGALIAVTEGSTRPVTVVVTNAGISVVEMYDLRMP